MFDDAGYSGRRGGERRGEAAAGVPGSTNGITLAPDGAPSPPAPLPRCAGERGEFDPATNGIDLRPRSPTPGPSPLVPRGEGRIRSRRDRLPAVLPPPRSLWGRAGEGGGLP